MNENFDSRVQLAAAARRVNQAIRVTGVDGGELDAVAKELGVLADRLAAVEVPGPHVQVGLGDLTTADVDARELTGPRAIFSFSPVIGALNPISPPAVFSADEHDVVHGTVVLGTAYNGPPWDLVHGGVIAEVFDELLGVAAMIGGGGGFTGRLTIHYRKPTPTNQELRLVGWVEDVSGRKITAKGQMFHGDVLTAEADGLFIGATEHDGPWVPAS